jgi:ribosomal protein S18 acetylase RimI-like enzyme
MEAIKLRPLFERDFPACLDLYRANLQIGKIPGNYEDEYVQTLEDPKVLTLVMEDGDGLIGCGSVCYAENHELANFSFGLIHPTKQGRGYGSCLLVARIALLVENEGETMVYLCATENSIGFYGKVVGFGEYHREVDRFGNKLFWLQLPLNGGLLKKSQDFIRESGVEIAAGVAVPIKRPQTGS